MSNPTFSIVYADPPWQFKPRGRATSANLPDSQTTGRIIPYPTMDTDAICALPVADICAPDCLLFLWATYPMLPEAFEVIRAWGFQYKTVGFTWVKRTQSNKGFHFGMGFWTRANPELCLLATRGHPRRRSKGVPNLLVAPVQDHSRKPAEIRDRIVTLCGDLPRAELFAREKAPGWHRWGNEVENSFAFLPKC